MSLVFNQLQNIVILEFYYI